MSETPVGVPHYRPVALRPLFEGRVWRETAFCLLALPLCVAGLVWLVATLVTGLALSITLLGLPLAAVSLAGARHLGTLARWQARALLRVRVADPAPPVHEPGFTGWVKGRLLDTAGWRAVLYLLVLFPAGLVGAVLALTLWPLALVLLPFTLATPWVVRGVGRLHGAAARELLGPVPMSERVRKLRESRDQVVDTAAADLRRIERDLHDGAQARLVTLAMDLGMAKEKLAGGGDPEQATSLVNEAHDEAKHALGELRDLVRGIHPAVLTDRGLDAALSALVSRATVPVALSVEVARRPAPAIEAIAYFAASELIVNVSRHSTASSATVTLRDVDDLLVLEVVDDGSGGADPAGGSGLAGLIERVESVDGCLLLDSPWGGPTRVRVELPCGS